MEWWWKAMLHFWGCCYLTIEFNHLESSCFLHAFYGKQKNFCNLLWVACTLEMYENQDGILQDYTSKTQFWEATQQNTSQKSIPRPAAEQDNSTEASSSSVIQLTLAAQRSRWVIQQPIQYKRTAALQLKECKLFLQGEKHPVQGAQLPGAMNMPLDGPNILTGALVCLNVQEGMCYWRIR